MRPWRVSSVPSSRSVRFSLFKNCDDLRAELFHGYPIIVLAMVSFAAGTAGVSIHSKTIFRVGSSKFNLASKAVVTNRSTSEISTLWLISTVLIVIDPDVERKENERENVKGREANYRNDCRNHKMKDVAKQDSVCSPV